MTTLDAADIKLTHNVLNLQQLKIDPEYDCQLLQTLRLSYLQILLYETFHIKRSPIVQHRFPPQRPILDSLMWCSQWQLQVLDLLSLVPPTIAMDVQSFILTLYNTIQRRMDTES